jgi:hypothetical protein
MSQLLLRFGQVGRCISQTVYGGRGHLSQDLLVQRRKLSNRNGIGNRKVKEE